MTRTRKYDITFGIIFLVMAVSAALTDTFPAIGLPLSADNPCPWARFVYHAYAENCDPFYAANPFFNQVAAILSVFLFIPFYVYLALGFFRANKNIRVPALIFAGALLYAMLLHIIHEFFYPVEELRVQNVAKYFGYSILYLVVPVALIFRLRKGF